MLRTKMLRSNSNSINVSYEQVQRSMSVTNTQLLVRASIIWNATGRTVNVVLMQWPVHKVHS
ncbi:unnamed protein product [Toxocara canis]|uniref:Uncharacterized protein n=1 Tax=Toxocara canis TaxID=6265 RepID=A0A3P7EW67_TOXCA|nr:unnamed protein product [Toxocara canis]